MKQTKKKTITLVLLLLTFVLYSTVKLTSQWSELEDLVWIWNNTLQLAEGKKIYTDVNILTMPLAFWIESLLPIVFGDNIIVHVIAGLVLGLMVLIVGYRVHNLVAVRDTWYRVVILLLGFLILQCCEFTYNWLSVILTLCICWLELVDFKNKGIKDLAIGATIGLVVITKQNIGATVVLATVLVCLMDKKYKSIGLRAAGASIVGVITVAIMLITGVFKDFWDIAVLGMFNFGSNNNQSYLDVLTGKDDVVTTVIAWVITLVSILGLVLNIVKVRDKRVLKTQMYWVASLIFLYPLGNSAHGYLAMVIGVIATACLADTKDIKESILERLKYGRLIKYLMELSVIPICVVTFGFIGYSLEQANFNSTNYDRYNSISIDKELADEINEVCGYIEKHDDAMMVDGSTAIYTYALGAYEKYFDQMLHGNMGTMPSEKLIENIENREETMFLIKTNTEEVFWQTDMDVVNYVRDNYTPIENVGSYTVYRKGATD